VVCVVYVVVREVSPDRIRAHLGVAAAEDSVPESHIKKLTAFSRQLSAKIDWLIADG
jgi:hypothetical protein